MHFVMSTFSNPAVVLHSLTPFDLPAQSAGSIFQQAHIGYVLYRISLK